MTPTLLSVGFIVFASLWIVRGLAVHVRLLFQIALTPVIGATIVIENGDVYAVVGGFGRDRMLIIISGKLGVLVMLFIR